MTVDVDIVARSAPSTVLATPEKAWNPPTAAHVLNDAGTGSFTIGLDDDELADVAFGRLFRVLEDSTVRFMGVIEHQRREQIVDGEEAHEVVVVTGRQHSALLDWLVVFPEGGAGAGQFSDVRVFNFANPAYDDSAWVSAVALARQGTNPNATSQWSPPYQDALLPANWHDPDAYWMGTTEGDWQDAPDGGWYLRWTFSVATAGKYRLEFAADNDARGIYLDGVEIGDGGFGYTQTYSKDVDLSVGDHVIAARIVNGTKIGNNPSAFLGSLWSLSDDELDSVVARTNAAADIVVLDTPTGTNANGDFYDIPRPGMTVGEVLDLLLDEAQARGAGSGWTWDFTGSADSASTAWPTEGEIVVQVGSGGLSVLRQLSESYIDWSVDADALVLHAYVTGDFGGAPGVSFVEGSSLTLLTAEGEG